MAVVTGGPRANMPAIVNWFEAARFVNWMNASAGFLPAYKFDANDTFQLWQPSDVGYDAANPFRNSQTHFFLPNANEWYKAAYYDPIGGQYFNYPTGSDTLPTAVASGTAAGTAVIDQPLSQGPADITHAGGLSPYGVMGLGGNVFEWEETEFDLVNNSRFGGRGVRGDDWFKITDFFLSASARPNVDPGFDSNVASGGAIGFRVASVPEPNSLLLGATATMSILALRRNTDNHIA